ncbi:RCC1 domain-containing protein [Yersinia intermedia]|uniref:RCC1 domain-containing protein n=1 Tax=Yersinia intermedia TaxID=631 RepID=UPI001F52C844|nr:hypothetical protein [Yersinia intermedia]UNK24777.1 hypothetical protein MNQ97_07330 [Yersinia intermedia]
MKNKLRTFFENRDGEAPPAPIMVDKKNFPGLNQATLSDPTNNLTVRIPFSPNMKVGTVVGLFWSKAGDEANAQEIAFTPNVISADDKMVAYKDILVVTAQLDIVDGNTTVFYTLAEPPGSNVIQSLPAEFLVKRTVPGGFDTDPATPNVNESLFAPDVNQKDVDKGNVGNIFATIKAYKNMTVGDKVTLSWAGVQDSKYVIKESDLNNSVVIPVTEDTIKKAGDYSDAIIRYEIRDTVNNWSLWSLSTMVSIDIEESIFTAPYAQEAVENVITIDKLNQKDVHIIIPVYLGIKLGDIVTLKWSGAQLLPANMVHTLAGSEHKYGYVFIIPFSQIRNMGGENVTVYYEVNGKKSQKINLTINGNSATLAAPIAPQAKSGILDLNSIPATDNFLVQLDKDINLVAEDLVTLYVSGTNSKGEYFDLFNLPHPVTASEVGKVLTIAIAQDQITMMAGGSLVITYTVTGKTSEDVSSSYPLELVLSPLSNNYPAPTIVEMVNAGILNPMDADANGEVHIRIGNYPNKARGDEILCSWVGKTSHTPPVINVPKAVNGVYADNFATIPRNIVQENIGSWVTVNYVVEDNAEDIFSSNNLIFNITEGLPAPTVDQAVGSTITLSQVPASGVTVTIAAAARLEESDKVVLKWTGQNTRSDTAMIEKTVTELEAGKPLTMTVSRGIVSGSSGELVTVGYTITRTRGIPGTFTSPENHYNVISTPASGKLQVMGARFSSGTSYGFGNVSSKYITAWSSDTNKPLDGAEWQYAGDTAWISGKRFRDISPERVLRVRTADDSVILSACNVAGNGVMTDPAFAVRRNNGHIIAWGSAIFGGEIPPTLLTIDDVVSVCASESAFAALRSTNKVISWGEAPDGIVPTSVAEMDNITQIAASGSAFAALRANGAVVAWGDADSGGKVPNDITLLTNITKVVGGEKGFVAFLKTGGIVSWGALALPADIKPLDDIIDIQSALGSFVALRRNKTVIGWGAAIPAVIAARDDIVELMASTNNSYVAKCSNGTLVAWGNYGGVIPALIAGFDDVVDVVSTSNTYIALRDNGTVVSWGNDSAIVNVIAEAAQLTDIVQICTTGSAAAVLRANGEVVTWGNSAYGGDNSSVQSLLTDVRALYATSTAFLALTKDNRVVTWGDPTGGGDSSAKQQYITGQLSYEMAPL